MPSCDGSNCGACSSGISNNVEYRRLHEENEDLRKRLKKLECNIEREVERKVNEKLKAKECLAEEEMREKLERQIKEDMIKNY